MTIESGGKNVVDWEVAADAIPASHKLRKAIHEAITQTCYPTEHSGPLPHTERETGRDTGEFKAKECTVVSKKTYGSFIVRIWSEQNNGGQRDIGARQPAEEKAAYAIVLIDLQTGARLGFASLVELMGYLAPFTK